MSLTSDQFGPPKNVMPDTHSTPVPAHRTPRARPLNIIVVDDDPALRTILSAGLAHFGHGVRTAADGTQLDALMDAAPADVIVLDVGLPGENGYEIAARLRRHWQGGIIMATGLGDVAQRVLGLDSGADIYLVKPVDLRELAAAVDSLARRLPASDLPDWRLDAAHSMLYSPRGTALPLTAHECLLLRALFKHPGANVARPILFRALGYPDGHHGDLRLEALASRLRAKVRKLAPGEPLPLRGRSNLGYAFLSNDAES
jgi:DNA-binding response OmpR family regulator